jgi:hypothetical protein
MLHGILYLNVVLLSSICSNSWTGVWSI